MDRFSLHFGARLADKPNGMSQASGIAPDLVENVSTLARALLAAARSWVLYPPTHPAVHEALERLALAIGASTSGVECSLGVTPDTLAVQGIPVPATQPVAEAAQFLHDRDVLRIDFASSPSTATLADLLEVLSQDTDTRREQGGPATAWARTGHASISIEQIDYRRVLEDHDVSADTPHDDVWQSIVNSISHGAMTFDEIAQQRLLEISRDSLRIGELAREAIALKCAADGSPMIAMQAATVVATFRHLANIVGVLKPEHVPDVMQKLAAATESLDPNVVMHVLQSDDDPNDQQQVVKRISGAFDDTKAARLLATALAIEGQATERLADVFNAIAPDQERRTRVLRMTRDILVETAFGKTTQFKMIWSSMEDLLLSYNERPYVSGGYRGALDGAGARADTMAARELPLEMAEWAHTLDQDHIRQLSVTMMIDLLALERTVDGAEGMAADIELLAEDLLVSGDFANAARVTTAMAEAAGSEDAVTREPCRAALDTLAHADALLETIGILSDLEPPQFEAFGTTCRDIGPEAVEALSTTMRTEADSFGRQRAADIIVGYGVPAIEFLAPLVAPNERWFVQLNGVRLLDRIGAPESVPLLQPLLRRGDPRVTPRVVSALAGIDDPVAARAIHTVLRTVTGSLRRVVIAALVKDGDQRVVPMLERILKESEPFGQDHLIVLDTMGALTSLDSARAVPPIATLIRRKRWFARRKRHAIKRTGVNLLLRIGSPAADRVIDEARQHGDRLLRRIIRKVQRAGGPAA